MSASRARLAALNNASWCDAVCSAHGQPGCFDDGLWWHAGPVPRFYPHAVTFENDPPHALARLAALAEVRRGAAWSVKDSFACLDLAPLGCSELFAATWLWREPRPFERSSVGRAQRITDAAALAGWEHAWAAGSAIGERVFLPALLDDPSTAVIGFERDDRVVAGVTAHRADGVVGLTNLFVRIDDDPQRYWKACVAAAAEAFAGLPLVCYELEAEAAAFERVGFESIGALRVWSRDRD